MIDSKYLSWCLERITDKFHSSLTFKDEIVLYYLSMDEYHNCVPECGHDTIHKIKLCMTNNINSCGQAKVAFKMGYYWVIGWQIMVFILMKADTDPYDAPNNDKWIALFINIFQLTMLFVLVANTRTPPK